MPGPSKPVVAVRACGSKMNTGSSDVVARTVASMPPRMSQERSAMKERRPWSSMARSSSMVSRRGAEGCQSTLLTSIDSWLPLGRTCDEIRGPVAVLLQGHWTAVHPGDCVPFSEQRQTCWREAAAMNSAVTSAGAIVHLRQPVEAPPRLPGPRGHSR